jgi:hypothetical protein
MGAMLPRVFVVYALLLTLSLSSALSPRGNRGVSDDKLSARSSEAEELTTITAIEVGELLLELSTTHGMSRDELTELLGDLLPSVRKRLRAEDFPFIHILEMLPDGTLGVLYHVRVYAVWLLRCLAILFIHLMFTSGIRYAFGRVRGKKRRNSGNLS